MVACSCAARFLLDATRHRSLHHFVEDVTALNDTLHSAQVTL
jgi:hypothetical protein